MTVYDFIAKKKDGTEVALNEYEGKVLLIVNTATECGFTPQYEDLQKLYDKFSNQGFEILDFPCNQFGNQAPGTDEEIKQFCTLNYGVKYSQFSKIDVNGENAIPLYKHLVSQKGFGGFDPNHKLTSVLENILGEANPNFKNEPDIKWNFTKFLVDRSGNVVERFEPTEEMKQVEAKIKELL